MSLTPDERLNLEKRLPEPPTGPIDFSKSKNFSSPQLTYSSPQISYLRKQLKAKEREIAIEKNRVEKANNTVMNLLLEKENMRAKLRQCEIRKAELAPKEQEQKNKKNKKGKRWWPTFTRGGKKTRRKALKRKKTRRTRKR